MSYYRLRTRSILTTVLVFGTFLLGLRLLSGRILPRPLSLPHISGSRKLLPCASLDGANDTLVILKTGATELQDKLPVHFDTTLLCYPNYLIFSDLEEEYEGHQIHDALKYVDPDVQRTNEDFELWRRLKEHGREVLRPDELSGPESKVSPMTGKGSNPGWKLDKWKFLPMVNATLNMYPDMKWYIFVETDTYIFWSTALAWLSTLDHTEPWYMGSQMQIGDVIFGHGGSGFVASREAMQLVVDFFVANQAEWERFTASHWAGDCVLGKAFKDAGAPLTWAWPTLQGLKPGSIDYTRYDYNKRLWCYPSMSYHHLSPNEVEDIWRFEQDWLASSDELVIHSDVFKLYILPHIEATRGTKTMWDNMANDWTKALSAESFDDCRLKCRAIEDCVQFAFSEGKCTTGTSPHWGEANPAVQSGWFLYRIEGFVDKMRVCEDEKWVTD